LRGSAAMQRRFAAATRLVEIWLFFVRALCIAAASGPAALPKTLAAVADIRKPDSRSR
jgi:hypothetical protein